MSLDKNLLKIVLSLIIVYFALGERVFATGPIDLLNQKYIVIVEHGFRESSPFDQILADIEVCKSFTYTPEFDNYSGHAEEVKKVIESSGTGLVTIPIAWGDLNDDKPFFQIFDCIHELAARFNIQGVNFSTGGLEIYKLGLQNAFLFEYVELKLAAKIKSFLDSHPAITLAFAVGNREERLEEVFCFPLTAACNHKQPSNLKCITAFRANNQVEYKPENLDPKALQIVGRYSENGNYIALPSEKQVLTSFLSPLFLSKYISKQMKTVSETVMVCDLNCKKQIKIPILVVHETKP